MDTQGTRPDGVSAQLEHYVERALELEEQDEAIDFEALCADHPELADAVREALGQEKVIRSWAGSPDVRDPLVDRVLLDRYRVVARIGAGAMGAVYRGFDQELKRDVAIKVLQPHLFGEADAEARFLREAEALAALRHPHVVAVYDRGVTSDGLHFLVMELLGGYPLSAILAALEERVESGGWDALYDVGWLEELLPGVELPERSYVRLCARWAADLAGGLAAAHAAGIYHRDVKPSNVFLAEDGRALLVDFGIAARENDATLTRGDTTLGTPRYMAPEQAVGPARPGPQLDVYSLAATLYHLVAAQPPYDGDVHQVLTVLQRDDPRPVGKLHAGLLVDFQAVIECGMARELGRRYSTAAAFETDLRAFLDNRPVTARRRGPVARLVRRARRSRAVQVTTLVTIVAAVSIGVPTWIATQDRERRKQHAGITDILPQTLTLGSDPVIRDAELRARIRALLDEAVALVPDDVPTRCLSAAFHLDHGNPPGAARDMAAVADAVGTPYARALGDRYTDANKAADVTLKGLPEPTAADSYLAAYHAMRRVRAQPTETVALYLRAVELLGHDESDLAARELVLLPRLALALMMRYAAPEQAKVELTALRDDAVELERLLGRRTSRTVYVIATARTELKEYGEALAGFEYLVEQALPSWSSFHNLGDIYGKTGALTASEDMLLRADRLRPDYYKTMHRLAMTLADLGRFDEALASADRIPEKLGWFSHDARGYTEQQRALRHLQHDEFEEARAAASRASEHFRSALQLDAPPQLWTNLAASDAMARDDFDALVEALAAGLVNRPRRPVHLQNLAAMLSDTPSARVVGHLKEFFVELADEQIQYDEETRAPHALTVQNHSRQEPAK